MNLKKNFWIILLAVITIIIMVLSITKLIDDTLGMTIAFALFMVFTIIVALNARKNDVKIIEYMMILFSVVTFILLIFTFKAYLISHATPEFEFQILATPNESEKELMFTHDGHDYYKYNLSEVNVVMEASQETKSLESALTSNEITLDEILSLAAKDTDTVGYERYLDYGQSKYDKDEYSIIICENNTKDVIFAPTNYEYESSICK